MVVSTSKLFKFVGSAIRRLRQADFPEWSLIFLSIVTQFKSPC